MKNYLFFGPPGAGKGTQSKLLHSYLKEKVGEEEVSYIETGALLREFVKTPDTPMKRKADEIISNGLLIASAVPITLWTSRVLYAKNVPEYIIYDGVGRKLVEIKVLVEFLKELFNAEMTAFFINIPEEEVYKRLLLRGREDDKEKIIKDRLEYYNEDEELTTASVNFLRNAESVRFEEIDGIGTIEEIHKRIVEKL